MLFLFWCVNSEITHSPFVSEKTNCTVYLSVWQHKISQSSFDQITALGRSYFSIFVDLNVYKIVTDQERVFVIIDLL